MRSRRKRLYVVHARLNDDENARLRAHRKITGQSATEVIREGLEAVIGGDEAARSKSDGEGR